MRPRHQLPATPADVLSASTPLITAAMNVAIKFAEIFKCWEHPYKNAATSFDEMTLLDMIYWAFKCAHPITRPEKQMQNFFATNGDNRVVGLPDGFTKESSITLGAAGDMLRSTGFDNSKDILFENVAGLLFDQTLSFANYESPITKQALKEEIISDRGPPTECASAAHFDIYKGHKGKNFTLLNTANNHMFDMGVEGIVETQKLLASEKIITIGTNEKPEEYGRAKTLVKDGIKLGFVSATFGLNGRTLPAEDAFRINVANLLSKFSEPDLDIFKRQIDDCKDQECDFIIASIHWGHEFEFFPRQRQVDVSHALAEMGVDAILSHHPHVIQPVEYYRTKRDANRIVVIAHSLGTLAWRFTAPYLALSLILNLVLTKGNIKGRTRTYIEQANVTPVFRSFTENNGHVEARIEKLADHMDGKRDLHPRSYIDEMKRLADLVLGSTAGA